MDSLAGFKRRTYAVILTVGFTGSCLAWLANELAGSISPFTRAAFVSVLLVSAVSIWTLLSGRLPVRIVEEAVYISIGAVLLAVLAYALYLEPQPGLTDVSLFSLYLWFPFIYIFVFLAHERFGALVRAGILYALSVLLSLPVFFLPAGERTPLEGVNTLGLTYVSGVSIITVLYFLTSMKDDLRRTELDAERLKRLADTDPLTGILNRRGLEPILSREVERAARTGGALSLIVFDLDDFKILNDTYGHDSGDEALINVARKVQPHLRENDSFARWGGEEFAVLVPDTGLEPAYLLADRLRITIEEHESATGWWISASFGVSSYRHNDSGTTLSKRADLALYRAKELGKNRTETSA
ncbi:GGDEF domain-containing protein [Rubrobacter aplysinae]|uniref:GGDEF domain-containing protein n=1 Tax=Rubrobacter aplysinae TaxID=909625 RepID=UPI00069F98D5|nr:GGDEF domain-containing protein [Rubrobacter aplysinae]